jgi:hypothetical protein
MSACVSNPSLLTGAKGAVSLLLLGPCAALIRRWREIKKLKENKITSGVLGLFYPHFLPHGLPHGLPPVQLSIEASC